MRNFQSHIYTAMGTSSFGKPSHKSSSTLEALKNFSTYKDE